MKTYSVKEIADQLGTSQETVRRWIRSGKLKAVSNTKKKGENKVILESALKSFLKSSPKYAAVMAASLPFGVGVMAGFSIADVLLTIAKAEKQKLLTAKVRADSVYAFLAARISDEQQKLESMLAERNDLERKIQIETELLNQLIDSLNEFDEGTMGKQTKTEEDM